MINLNKFLSKISGAIILISGTITIIAFSLKQCIALHCFKQQNNKLEDVNSKQQDISEISSDLENSSKNLAENKVVLIDPLIDIDGNGGIVKPQGTLCCGDGNGEEIKKSLNIHNCGQKVLEEEDSIFSKLMSFINSKSNYIGEDLINLLNALVENWRDFLSLLTTEQVGALGHILLSIGMLFSIFNILSILFGDFLITYFNLEKKHPRLWRLIKIRRMFKKYSLILHFFILVMILLLILVANTIVLMGRF